MVKELKVRTSKMEDVEWKKYEVEVFYNTNIINIYSLTQLCDDFWGVPEQVNQYLIKGEYMTTVINHIKKINYIDEWELYVGSALFRYCILKECF